MIINIHPHGRTPSARSALAAHLTATTGGQGVRLVRVRGTIADAVEGAIACFARLRALSERARIAFWHLNLNPIRFWNATQRDEAVRRILKALSAERHAYALIEHTAKPRARGEGAPTHYHLLIANVGRDGRALNPSFAYVRLEAVRATLEVDFGEAVTPSRRTDAVVRRLHRDGRPDVASAVEAVRPASDAQPKSGLSTATRARLARVGLSAPGLRAQVIDIYRRGEEGTSLCPALADIGLTLMEGKRTGIWIVKAGDHLVGSLDRLVARPRAEIATRMTVPPRAVSPETGPKRADATIEIGSVDDVSLATQEQTGSQKISVAAASWTRHIQGLIDASQTALEEAERRTERPERTRLIAMVERRVVAARAAREAAELVLVEQMRKMAPSGWFNRILGRTALHESLMRTVRADVARAMHRLETVKERKAHIGGRVAAELRHWQETVAREDREQAREEHRLKGQIELWREALAVIEADPQVAVGGSAAIKEAVLTKRAELRKIQPWSRGSRPSPAHGSTPPISTVPRSSTASP